MGDGGWGADGVFCSYKPGSGANQESQKDSVSVIESRISRPRTGLARDLSPNRLVSARTHMAAR